MPTIPTKIVKPLPEPLEGKTYEILEAKMKETNDGKDSFKGVEVKFAEIVKGETMNDEAHAAQTMLWFKDEAGASSKLGCFILALGDNTDDWIGKVLLFKEWKNKHRAVEVVED